MKNLTTAQLLEAIGKLSADDRAKLLTKARKNGQHTAKTPEHGTPPEYVAIARQVLGTIDVDPATSDAWNELVGAERIFTKSHSGIANAWFDGAPAPNRLLTDDRETPAPLLDALLLGRHAEARAIATQFGICIGTVFCNPPGDKQLDLVARFWTALAEYYRRGFVTAAIWVGFSVEQLARLQRVGAPSHPLQHTTLVPDERIAYRNTPTTIGDQPSHASFVTLLSDDIHKIELFRALGTPLGHVIEGSRPRRM